jgi:urease accessory protein
VTGGPGVVSASASAPTRGVGITAVSRGSLTVARGPRGSVVTRAYAEAPLKWLTPDTGRGGAAWAFASSYGGGLVGGDRLAIDIGVEPGACALVSTQASTKVYRSPKGAEVTLAAAVGRGGVLVSLPDPVVCFAGSTFHQRQAFELESGAAVVALDWMTSGRLGHGERWAFDAYASATTIRVDGRLVIHDAVRLSRDDGELAARLGRFEVLALIAVAGEPLAAQASALVAAVGAIAPARRQTVVVSAGATAGHGCVVRLAGTGVEAVRHAVRDLLAFVPALLGDDPWARKW